jgi:SAM-dependent methyltransferase
MKDVKPYAYGSHMMWTDPYISQKLLAVHLDPVNAAASRTPQAIEDTVACIHKRIKPGSRILDLGCGPGLYAARLAAMGHQVTGIDFSENSIKYAKTRPDATLYDIHYEQANYLELNYKEEFDLVMIIYCDFGVLIPDDRNRLIEVIRKALKPGGIFFFDALTEDAADRLTYGTSWESETASGGFYSPESYICLNDSRRFPENKATLDQHLVILEDGSAKLYRFWNHYLNQEDVRRLFLPHGFSEVEAIEGLLHGDGPYQDHGVVFYEVKKELSE